MTSSPDLGPLAREYYEFTYRALPSEATILGIHKYDDQLGDFSRAAMADYLARVKDFLVRLRRTDPGTLPLKEGVNWQLLESDMLTRIQYLEVLTTWRKDPNFYIDPPLNGMLVLLIRDFAGLPERLKSLEARLRSLKGVLDTAQQNLDNPPEVFTVVAIETVEGAIAFLEEVVPGVAKQAPNLEARVLAAKNEAVAACKAYLNYLRTDLLPRSRGRFAVGRAVFEELLRAEEMIDLSADEVLALGRQAFEETKRELESLAQTIGHGRSWEDLIDEARQEHPAAGDLLKVYREEVNRLRTFVADRKLVRIPSNEALEVVDTPVFARSTIPYAAYLAPAPFETSQKGEFWVTPVPKNATTAEQQAQLEENSYFAISGTALHEAYPGHHLQLVYSDDVSDFVRKHISSSQFAEGWAFYCEQLMREQGYVPGNIAGRDRRLFDLFLLKDQLWRAARVLIAVGLHTQEMTIEEAVRFLVNEVKLKEGPARVEVHRYALTPIQPLSYTLGKLEILKLRSELKDLPLQEFHDRLLDHGTIPFRAVREEMLRQA